MTNNTGNNKISPWNDDQDDDGDDDEDDADDDNLL